MKRLGRVVLLAMLTAALMAPGLAGTASAQSVWDLCDLARSADEGDDVEGYTMVYGAGGGSGSQIVVSDPYGVLSGGSGDDILCSWGVGYTLEGGSGNDTLIVMSGASNVLNGGSGNDTMIGNVGDEFNGGSGQNTTDYLPQVLFISEDINANYFVGGRGFTPGENGTVAITLYDSSSGVVGNLSGVFSANEAGLFFASTSGNPNGEPYTLCADSSVTSAYISATETDTGVHQEQEFALDCS